MDETFDFLDLPRIDIGNRTRVCVKGKAGVMDVLNQFEGRVEIGGKASQPETVKVGDCDNSIGGDEMHQEESTGALHHNIDPQLNQRMRTYYEPFNQRLYKFLGKDLGW